MMDGHTPEPETDGCTMKNIVRLEAELLGQPDSKPTNTLFDTALRTHLAMLQHGLEEPLLIAGQVYAEAKDLHRDADPEKAIEFTRAFETYLAEQGIETLDELLDWESTLLNQHRIVQDRQLE